MIEASTTATHKRHLALEGAARRLREAAASHTPCAPVRDLIAADDTAGAYAVQRQIVAERVSAGATAVGRKVGLTSSAVQAQLGVHQPDFGVLLDDMRVEHNGIVPRGVLLQPKVEAEIAFILGKDLIEGSLDPDDVASAVQAVAPALEIVDSRIAEWDITFVDTVADNGSCGLFVLGKERRPLAEVDLVAAQMTMQVDGSVVSTGTGAACLGDPLNALSWLARTAREVGDPLRAGDVVLSGALGPMVAAAPGADVRAEITDLGEIRVRFAS